MSENNNEIIALQAQLQEELREHAKKVKEQKKALAEKEKKHAETSDKAIENIVGLPFKLIDKTISQINIGINGNGIKGNPGEKGMNFGDGTNALFSIYRLFKEVVKIIPELAGVITTTVVTGIALNSASNQQKLAAEKAGKELSKALGGNPRAKEITDRIKLLKKAEEEILNGNLKQAKETLHRQMEELKQKESKQIPKTATVTPPIGEFTSKESNKTDQSNALSVQ